MPHRKDERSLVDILHLYITEDNHCHKQYSYSQVMVLWFGQTQAKYSPAVHSDHSTARRLSWGQSPSTQHSWYHLADTRSSFLRSWTSQLHISELQHIEKMTTNTVSGWCTVSLKNSWENGAFSDYREVVASEGSSSGQPDHSHWLLMVLHSKKTRSKRHKEK